MDSSTNNGAGNSSLHLTTTMQFDSQAEDEDREELGSDFNIENAIASFKDMFQVKGIDGILNGISIAVLIGMTRTLAKRPLVTALVAKFNSMEALDKIINSQTTPSHSNGSFRRDVISACSLHALMAC
jgi:hypothetical protein